MPAVWIVCRNGTIQEHRLFAGKRVKVSCQRSLVLLTSSVTLLPTQPNYGLNAQTDCGRFAKRYIRDLCSLVQQGKTLRATAV